METVFGYEYTTRTHLLVSDEDAADFLQSQFTNDLRPFEAGHATYGLWLDVKGKVIADSTVLCEGDESFRLISETSDAAALVDLRLATLPAGLYAHALQATAGSAGSQWSSGRRPTTLML